MDHRIAISRNYWDRHARHDPMWAVLSDPAKKGRKWNLQEFMKNGEREIALLCHKLEQLQLVPDWGTALDFGCGIGRLTQALARRFGRVTGVDISPLMIAIAQELNQYSSSAEYVCNDNPDLRELPARSCDLIYSNIVLQHVVPQLSITYLHEFFRLLRPGGVLVFQLPSHQEPPAEGALKPMPNEAYHARVELTSALPTDPGASELLAAVRITNTSQYEWRQRESGSIRVGNHWFDASGRYMVIQDDGRAVLPQVMAPGQSCDVVLPIVPPRTPGSYEGEIDVVHEGVTWFREKGSATLRFNVEVKAHDPGCVHGSTAILELPIPDYSEEMAPLLVDASWTPGDTDPFPMYGVPRAQVVDIVRHHGGTLVHIEDGLRAGVEWVDYRYFVRAPEKS